jgi:O-antigen ligase
MALQHFGSLLARQLPAWFFFGFLTLCIIGGGSSRAEVQIQPLIWLASILVCGTALWFRPLDAFMPARTALLFIGLLMLAALIQLIPLPPDVWTRLAGRAPYVEAAQLAGIAQPWRPISLTPDLTLACVLTLFPLFAVVIGYQSLDALARKWVLPLLLLAALGSAFLGLMQISVGPGSGLRYYIVTNDDSAVGIFANRNHHAVFLSAALPMLAVWARLDPGDERIAQIRYWLSLGCGLFILPMIIATGSRAGIGLALVGVFGAFLLSRSPSGDQGSRRYATLALWQRALPFVAIAVVAVGTAIMARTSAVERLFASSYAEEQRSQMIGPLSEMARAFFPFGSGYGSFDPVYRAFEPFDLLNTAYMNHAHNDLFQIVIEGGLLAVCILVLYMIWWLTRVRAHWSRPKKLSSSRLMGRLGSVVTLIMLLSSLVDYPLRMPLLSVVFMIASLWMLANPEPPRALPAPPTS